MYVLMKQLAKKGCVFNYFFETLFVFFVLFAFAALARGAFRLRSGVCVCPQVSLSSAEVSRAVDASDLIATFMFAIPKARAPPPVLTCSAPSASVRASVGLYKLNPVVDP